MKNPNLDEEGCRTNTNDFFNRVTRSLVGNTKPDLFRTTRACEGHGEK